ncbi:MAG: NAD(P)H-dependent oxidoreductase subunit E [Sporomusaceae bacterium]|nr:NAD(P)H-dependent oxidoreductase subunit E [Sporomusaceae bacterium]
MEKLVVEICAGTSCYLLGSQDLIDALETLPQEKRAKIDLRGITCLKACGYGPNVRVKGVVLSNMTPERLLQVIDDNL